MFKVHRTPGFVQGFGSGNCVATFLGFELNVCGFDVAFTDLVSHLVSHLADDKGLLLDRGAFWGFLGLFAGHVALRDRVGRNEPLFDYTRFI